MNKDELIAELGERFHTVDIEGLYKGDTIASITVWQIRVFEEINGVMKRPTLTFYTDSEDNAFWGNSEPNPIILIPDPTFTDRVNTFIASKIADKTIEFAYIEQISDNIKKVLVTAIMSDKTEKKAIISEDAQGKFTLNQL